MCQRSSTSFNVYLDDERPTLDGWVRAFTGHEAISFLETNNVYKISLDHDLGDEEVVLNGWIVLKWIIEKTFLDDAYIPPRVFVHTANSARRAMMIEEAQKLWYIRKERLALLNQ